MARYYTRYNASARSYSVIDRERRNEYGDPSVVLPLVTEIEARRECERLNGVPVQRDTLVDEGIVPASFVFPSDDLPF